jgi:plasmid stability protein
VKRIVILPPNAVRVEHADHTGSWEDLGREIARALYAALPVAAYHALAAQLEENDVCDHECDDCEFDGGDCPWLFEP